MSKPSAKDELVNLSSTIAKHWQNQTVQIAEQERIDGVLEKLSLFAKGKADNCEDIITELKKLITTLSKQVEKEEKTLQAETHGGQVFTDEEQPLYDEYGYRNEMIKQLELALNIIYEVRPEFKPR